MSITRVIEEYWSAAYETAFGGRDIISKGCESFFTASAKKAKIMDDPTRQAVRLTRSDIPSVLHSLFSSFIVSLMILHVVHARVLTRDNRVYPRIFFADIT